MKRTSKLDDIFNSIYNKKFYALVYNKVAIGIMHITTVEKAKLLKKVKLPKQDDVSIEIIELNAVKNKDEAKKYIDTYLKAMKYIDKYLEL